MVCHSQLQDATWVKKMEISVLGGGEKKKEVEITVGFRLGYYISVNNSYISSI